MGKSLRNRLRNGWLGVNTSDAKRRLPAAERTLIRPDHQALGDDGGGSAIFHRPAGIQPFGFGEQLDAGTGLLHAPEAHQRRVADQLHHGRPSASWPTLVLVWRPILALLFHLTAGTAAVLLIPS